MLRRTKGAITGKRERLDEIALEEGRQGAEFYGDFAPSLNSLYPHELAMLSKQLQVPQRKIRIIDHPCGELAVFVTYPQGEVFEGYLQNILR